MDILKRTSLYVPAAAFLIAACTMAGGGIDLPDTGSFSSVSSTSSPSSTSSTSSFDPLVALSLQEPPAGEVLLDVPFTAQAPHGNWDPPFDEACEEASLLMVQALYDQAVLSPDVAAQKIDALVAWETERAYAVDITAAQTAEIASAYFGSAAIVYTDDVVTSENIRRLLGDGYPVIIPAAGHMLGNPYYSGDGPPYHMLVITGWKPSGLFRSAHFITNDPGTRRGEGYAYDEETIMEAIHDWTGSKETVREGRKAMVVLEKT